MRYVQRFLVFYLVLRPLILENYKMRREGLVDDEWFWADEIGFRWGYSVTLD